MTQRINRDDEDVKKYLQYHGVAVKSDGEGGLYLKLPVPCKQFDSEKKLCKAHDSRPDVCRIYPLQESPFISKAECSLLRQRSIG